MAEPRLLAPVRSATRSLLIGESKYLTIVNQTRSRGPYPDLAEYTGVSDGKMSQCVHPVAAVWLCIFPMETFTKHDYLLDPREYIYIYVYKDHCVSSKLCLESLIV